MANLPRRVSVRLMALAKNSDGHRDHCARSAFGAGLSFAAGASPASLAHRRADEMSVQEMDNATFAAYVARENAIFTALDAEVTAKVTPAERTPLNRYYRQSPVWRDTFPRMQTGRSC